LSALLVAMAPYVSRFVTRLFDVEGPTSAIREATRSQDVLFRFKADFVRKRALPLVKGGARPAPLPEDDAVVERLAGQTADGASADFELAVARAGCELLDREKTDKEGVAADMEALKRWC